MLPKDRMRLDPFVISLESFGPLIAYVSTVLMGAIVKYQKTNEMAMRIIPMRKITMGLSMLFLGLAKGCSPFLGWV